MYSRADRALHPSTPCRTPVEPTPICQMQPSKHGMNWGCQGQAWTVWGPLLAGCTIGLQYRTHSIQLLHSTYYVVPAPTTTM